MTTATQLYHDDIRLLKVPAMVLDETEKELGFFCDFVGLVNNEFDVIDERTRTDMLILAVERVNKLRLKMQDALKIKAEY